MNEQKNLNYIAGLIIQTFRKTGLDEAYIQDKRYQFLEHENKYESLLWGQHRIRTI
jgi:hypothetical protein